MIYYICALYTFISALVSFGFSLEALLKSRKVNGDAVINAKYAVSRSLSLLIVALGLFIFKSDAFLVALSLVMIGAQLFDGIIGIKISTFKTVGPLLTAVGNVIMLILFLTI
ncbi:hypothetical protein CY659_10140 [Listeria monocytogenes serotype 4b]|nr:hypothetical protein [Listeria monocytogenes serotype 4b]EAF4548360.1 hypothetical protein [Listeria monocytogenes serotype 1/2a]EJT7859063.1 hypothetical protein [Listeria monocytogenes]EHC5256893.1 hypothetical protein [Listeria monocytogenes serotype 1/2a]EHC5295523.1 hypothetical protein [Listeria monocytogenes serotype 1/2a]